MESDPEKKTTNEQENQEGENVDENLLKIQEEKEKDQKIMEDLLNKNKELEKLINDTINRINDEMNQEIKVNYDMWKKGILDQTNVLESQSQKETKSIVNIEIKE